MLQYEEELHREAAWVTKGRVKERRGNAFVLFCLGNDPPAISRLALMDWGGEYTQLFPAVRMLSGRETEQEQGLTWLRFLIKGIVLCVLFSYISRFKWGYFIFNYSLLVKRTSRPDGYRPDCKCSENLYLTVEVTTTLSLAFHHILWTARSIVKYQLSVCLWDAMEGFV